MYMNTHPFLKRFERPQCSEKLHDVKKKFSITHSFKSLKNDLKTQVTVQKLLLPDLEIGRTIPKSALVLIILEGQGTSRQKALNIPSPTTQHLALVTHPLVDEKKIVHVELNSPPHMTANNINQRCTCVLFISLFGESDRIIF